MKATVTSNNGSLELVEVNPYQPTIVVSENGKPRKIPTAEYIDFKPTKFHTEEKDLIIGSIVDMDDFNIVDEYMQHDGDRLWFTCSKSILEIAKYNGQPTRQTARKKAVAETPTEPSFASWVNTILPAITVEGKETEQGELWNELLADIYQVIDFKIYPERLSFFKSKYTITKKYL